MFTANIIVISSIFKANYLMNDSLHDKCFIPLQHSFSRTTSQVYITIFTVT